MMPAEAIDKFVPLQDGSHPMLTIYALWYWVPFGIWLASLFMLPHCLGSNSKAVVQFSLVFLILCGAMVAPAIGMAWVEYLIVNEAARSIDGGFLSIIFYNRIGAYGAAVSAIAALITAGATVRAFLAASSGSKPAEQGVGQPATRPESKAEGGEEPQPESEGRSR